MKTNSLKKYRYFIFSVLFIFIAAAGFCEDVTQEKLFQFKYTEGQSYRILSQVHEDVFINNTLDHHAEIINRVTVQSTEVHDDGSAVLKATFATSEDSQGAVTGRHFTLGQDYESTFSRTKEGTYSIGDEYFMPTVRNVPVFPDKELKPGDTWTAPGYEVHDLRRTFHIDKPFKVPFTADYTYKEEQTDSETGKNFDVFDVQYNLYYESPEPENNKTRTGYEPATTMGFSHQTIYWDNKKGAIDHYDENFMIVIESINGTLFKFKGTAEAEVAELKNTSSDENVKQVQKKVKDLGLDNVSVSAGEKGLTISLEKIQFEPDSAILRQSEKDKLQKIAAILNEYKDNDLLVSGYCAMAGTEEARKELSEERAEAVADYLTGIGVRDANHIFTEGLGAENPIASNDTEEGRVQNRRVEITIMDK